MVFAGRLLSQARRIAGLLAVLFALSAQQAIAGAADSHIRAALAVETLQPKPGSTVRVAIQMTPKKGWHGYWQNPGDSGLPATVRWEAPAGIRFSRLQHPAPQLLSVQGIASYVHEGPFALVAEMRVPSALTPGTRFPLVAHLSWIACSDSLCVPERATLTSELSIGDGSPDPQGRHLVSQAAARVPKPLSNATLATTGAGEWLFTIPDQGKLRAGAARIYPDTPAWFAPDAAQRVQRVAGNLHVRVSQLRKGQDESFSGIVSDGKTSFRIAPSLVSLTAADVRQTITSDTALPTDEVTSSSDGLAENWVPVQSDGDNIPPNVQPATAAAARSPTASLLATSVLAAILGGLLLNLMPCVFPILSLKALNLARSGADRKSAHREGLGYAAGSVLTASVLGAVLILLKAAGHEVGWSFQLQSPFVVLLLLLLTSAIALNLAGLFDVRLPAPTVGSLPGHGWMGGFSTGALAALIATPCSGPFMAGALGAALVLPPLAALLVFAGLGFGMALPFLTIAWFPALQRRMPRPGPWMNGLRRLLSLPMFATALALAWILGRQTGVDGMAIGLTVAFLLGVSLWWLGARQAVARPAWPALIPGALALATLVIVGPPTGAAPANQSGDDPLHQAFSERRLAELRKQGTPVFVDFTADWCLTCNVNEQVAIETNATQAAFATAGVVTLTGDWTRGDPEITRFLAKHGRNSIPFYLYYAPDREARLLPQLLTSELLAGLPGKGR